MEKTDELVVHFEEREPKFKIGDTVMENYDYGSGVTVVVGKIISLSTYDRLGPNRWSYVVQVDWNKSITREEEELFLFDHLLSGKTNNS